jgi:hypothetical protein
MDGRGAWGSGNLQASPVKIQSRISGGFHGVEVPDFSGGGGGRGKFDRMNRIFQDLQELSGNASHDAKRYQERDVEKAIREAGK